MSIDDLFATLPAAPRLGGSGPFVINLSASTAPVSLPPSSIKFGSDVYVYQIQRMEDRRLRYRLRLGSFETEDEADSILQKVRDAYPGALTATADAEDLRAMATLSAKAAAHPARNVKTGGASSNTVVVPPPPASVVTPDPAPAAAPVAIMLTPPAATQVPIPMVTPPLATLSARVHSLETTLTVRALTMLETEDYAAMRWFVIQLSVAQDPFDPETLPDLDIFSVYRLYSVAGIDHGRILHALRLGFFTEEPAAAAVSCYLATYYPNPTIKRVSMAERERFANQRLAPRKDVGATGRHAVIEITDEPYVRNRPVAQPITKTANVTAPLARRSLFGKK